MKMIDHTTTTPLKLELVKPDVEPFTIRVPVEEINGPLVENFSEDFTWEDIVSGELYQSGYADSECLTEEDE